MQGRLLVDTYGPIATKASATLLHDLGANAIVQEMKCSLIKFFRGGPRRATQGFWSEMKYCRVLTTNFQLFASIYSTKIVCSYFYIGRK